MKPYRRILAALISILLLGQYGGFAAAAAVGENLPDLPEITVLAAQTGTFTDSSFSWTLDDDGLLTIRGTGVMPCEKPWGNNAYITQIVLEEGLTQLPDDAFTGCSSVTAVTLPSTLTDIGDRAFYNCGALMSINFPQGLLTIGDSAFRWCTALKKITLPGSLTNFANAFPQAGLEQVTLQSGITTISMNAFSNCSSLREITIPETVTSVGEEAFWRCSSLTSISLPDTVTRLDAGAFQDTGLTSFSIPAGLTELSNNVLSNTDITSISIPAHITTIGSGAFSGCDQMQTLTIAEGVTAIGANAFENCSSLTEITVPDSVTSIAGYAFKWCSSLATVRLPDQLKVLSESVFAECEALESINMPAALEVIEAGALDLCKKIRTIILPSGVREIRDRAFRGCESLQEVVIPASVTSIAGGTTNSAFYWCSNFTLYVEQGSYAETYAMENNYTYEYIVDGNRLSLTVTGQDGAPVTEGYTIVWHNGDTEEWLGSGNAILVDESVSQVSYQVVLDESLAFTYRQPDQVFVEVQEGDSALTCVLEPMESADITGCVKNESDEALQSAQVTLTQRTATGYEQVLGPVTTDEEGWFTLTGCRLEGTLSIQAEGYYARNIDLIQPSSETQHAGIIRLTPIPEARIQLELKLQHATAVGEDAITTSLTDWTGLEFTVFNRTQNKEIPDVTIQAPYLVVGNAASDGDVLQISVQDTAGRMTGGEPTEVIYSVAGSKATITMLQNGYMEANLVGSGSKRVFLFDSNAKGLGSYSVGELLFTSDCLPAGHYQIAVMEKTSLLSHVSNLSILTTMGLVEGTDYLLKDVEIKNGAVTELGDLSVP